MAESGEELLTGEGEEETAMEKQQYDMNEIRVNDAEAAVSKELAKVMESEQRSGEPAQKKEEKDEAAAEEEDAKKAAEQSSLIGKSPEANDKYATHLQNCQEKRDQLVPEVANA